MKKNVIMRAACVVLVLTLLSTCMISGTFAKYVTEAPDATDTARVADWGVTATVTGAAFAKNYNKDVDTHSIAVTVESSTDDKLVAPGTEGTFTGVALTGTPEVAFNVTKTATVAVEGWIVDTEFYCPMVITINSTPISGLDFDSADEFEAAIQAAIEAGNGDYEPNTNLATIANMNGDYDWAWAFETGADDPAKAANNVKDTKLGDIEAADPDVDVNTITLTVDAKVTQLD